MTSYYLYHDECKERGFWHAYLEALHTRLQATDLPQKLQAIPEKSPDLLGVILKEGKV